MVLFGKQDVDECGYITDVDFAIIVHIGSLSRVGVNISSQQNVDECGHITDVHLAVTVHVTLEETILAGDVGNGIFVGRGGDFQIDVTADASHVNALVLIVALTEDDIEHIVLAIDVEGAVVELLSHYSLGGGYIYSGPSVADGSRAVPGVDIDAVPVVGRHGRVFEIDGGGIGYEAMEDVFALYHIAHLALIEDTCSEHGVIGKCEVHLSHGLRAVGSRRCSIGGIDDNRITLAGGNSDVNTALILAARFVDGQGGGGRGVVGYLMMPGAVNVVAVVAEGQIAGLLRKT